MSEPSNHMPGPADLGAASPTASHHRPVAGPDVPYIAALNSAQREAVEATEGPVLVLAGAGTGKTRVLTTRLAHILQLRLAWPSQVLAVTFTNRAARDMQARVAEHLGGPAEGLWIGTFHAMSARVLRRHAELVGLKSNFTILDTDDQIRLLKQVLGDANIDEKRWSARVLLALIERWKDRGLSPGRVSADDAGSFAMGRAVDLYAAYQRRLVSLNAADFGDLLLHCLDLFTAHTDVLADYQRRFKYVLVDEYQDSNVAQYLWLRLLARQHRNICCVGDDDQSIYSWRGAEVGNILRFEQDFPGARVIRLERNYRSTPHILACAAALIAHNESRLGKTLWTEANEGEKVAVQGVWDSREEARVVADEIESAQRNGRALGDMAILVRASSQTREFEERFIQIGLPYRVVGGSRFYERREVRDALAYLRVIVQPDDDLAFERIVNVPRRGIGDASLQAVHLLARTQDIPLGRAARLLVETDELKSRARRSLAALLDSFDRWRAREGEVPHPELAEMVLEESGYMDMWRADPAADAPGRLDNLIELIRALEDFENLGGFLQHVSLVMDIDEAAEGDLVSLSTLHGAKGLEFDTVFLPGWEEGLFPNQRSLDEGGNAALEEERRLAHVGLTRARHRVHITFAASRRLFGEMSHGNLPSRFVDELPAEHVEAIAETGVYGLPGDRERHRFTSHGAGLAETDAAVEPLALHHARERPRLGRRSSRYRRDITSHSVVIEGRAEHIAPAEDSSPPLTPGQRVFHQKFGYGLITSAEGDRLEIAFDKAGVKKVIASFVVAV